MAVFIIDALSPRTFLPLRVHGQGGVSFPIFSARQSPRGPRVIVSTASG